MEPASKCFSHRVISHRVFQHLLLVGVLSGLLAFAIDSAFAGTALSIYSVNASGNNPTNQAGGVGPDGGTVDIRTGVQVDSGDGHHGDLLVSTRLTTGSYYYRQVVCNELEIDGDVTIYCQNVFAATKITGVFRSSSLPPSLQVFAGTAYRVTTQDEETTFIPTNHAISNAVFSASSSAPDYPPGDVGFAGGRFQFWTAHSGAIAFGVIEANGGRSPGFQQGGKGGNANLISFGGTIQGYQIYNSLLRANGGGGGPINPPAPHDLAGFPPGGGGGKIYVQAKAIADIRIEAEGGYAGGGPSGGPIKPWPYPGYNGGRGGDGGVVRVNIQHLTNGVSGYIPTIYARGGYGGYGRPGYYKAPEDGNANVGADGGRGGDGGTGGLVVFDNFSLTSFTNGGNGGNGSWGGAGSTIPCARAGNYGDGGNAGWPNGTPGTSFPQITGCLPPSSPGQNGQPATQVASPPPPNPPNFSPSSDIGAFDVRSPTLSGTLISFPVSTIEAIQGPLAVATQRRIDFSNEADALVRKPRVGAVTDGVTQVLIRAGAANSGTVTFTVENVSGG